MAQLCTNAPPITNSVFNGSHLHQCLLTHSECTQPTQMKCSPYTLKLYSTNSNQVLSLHTQNALNQLKTSALLKHPECTQPIQIKTYNAGMWTHAHSMLRNTSKEHQSSTCALQTRDGLQSSSKLLQGSKSLSKNPPEWKLAPPTDTKPQDLS